MLLCDWALVGTNWQTFGQIGFVPVRLERLDTNVANPVSLTIFLFRGGRARGLTITGKQKNACGFMHQDVCKDLRRVQLSVSPLNVHFRFFLLRAKKQLRRRAMFHELAHEHIDALITGASSLRHVVGNDHDRVLFA